MLSTLPTRRAASEMFRFLQVGAIGYIINIVVFYSLRHINVTIAPALIVAFGCAATLTWVLNRRYTFETRPRAKPVGQWLRFLSANAVGALIYVGAFVLFTHSSKIFSTFPALTILLSAGVAFVSNFVLSSRLVFASALSTEEN